MKFSAMTILTGVVAAGALGAVGYKSITGNSVFGPCSSKVDAPIAATDGAQLVGLSEGAKQDKSANPGHCSSTKPADTMLVKADPSQCDGDKPSEIVALSSDQAADKQECSMGLGAEKECSETMTEKECDMTMAEMECDMTKSGETQAALDRPAGEG